MNFVGLDIETTGLDRRQGHRLIQIGIAFHRLAVLSMDVKPEGRIVFDPEAMAVNKISRERIVQAQFQREVDCLLVESLEARGLREGDLTAVGWNVGSFDLPFVREELPLTAKFFSHRVIDLTGIAMFLARGQDNWRELKEQGHRQIEGLLGQANWHDAGFDALAGFLQWDLWVRNRMFIFPPRFGGSHVGSQEF